MDSEHILLLGATGVSGVVFIHRALSLPQAPYLTLYIRGSSRSKLPAIASSHSRIRIVEGQLDDYKALRSAFSSSNFPKVTTVVSVLGAYVVLSNMFTRDASHPIADAMRSTVVPVMKELGVKRIFALSTPSGFPLPGEYENLSWLWWLLLIVMPSVVVPAGKAEMKGIADAVLREDDLDFTIFRVPHLVGEDGKGDEQVVAGTLGKNYQGTTELTRASMCKWILREIEERKWVRQVPFLGNM